MVLGARFADRIGKGIRGAPRDALVADVTPLSIRGRAFGLRQALDTVGAFLGPLLAIGLMFVFANDMGSVFWIAAIPAVIAVLLIVWAVDDREPQDVVARPPLRMRDMSNFDMAFWSVVAIGLAFTLARFSEAFLILKANAEGLPLALAPLVLVTMNLVYSLGAHRRSPVGSDRWASPACPRPRMSGPGRPHPRLRTRLNWCVRRNCALGFAHGAQPRTVCKAGGRPVAGNLAGHRLWSLQPRDGSGTIAGQRRRRSTLGSGGTKRDLHSWRPFRGGAMLMLMLTSSRSQRPAKPTNVGL